MLNIYRKLSDTEGGAVPHDSYVLTQLFEQFAIRHLRPSMSFMMFKSLNWDSIKSPHLSKNVWLLCDVGFAPSTRAAAGSSPRRIFGRFKHNMR